MSLDMKDYNILGSIINSTFGSSSQSSKHQTYSVKIGLSGDVATFTAITVINLADQYRMDEEIKKCERELNQVINHKLAEVKKEFKAEAKKALKIKKIKDSEDTSTELMGYYSSYSPIRTACVRRKIDFTIG